MWVKGEGVSHLPIINGRVDYSWRRTVMPVHVACILMMDRKQGNSHQQFGQLPRWRHTGIAWQMSPTQSLLGGSVVCCVIAHARQVFNLCHIVKWRNTYSLHTFLMRVVKSYCVIAHTRQVS